MKTLIRSILFGLGVMFLVVLAACNPPAQKLSANDISPTSTVMADQNWVIVARDQAEEMGIGSWLVESDDFWTPSVTDIMELEQEIAGYLSQNSHIFYRQPPVWERLGEYQRQYIGLERGGEQVIYGNYFCNSVGIDWRQQLVIVDDGGECFFQVEYDVESGLFIQLWVNGES